MTYTTHGHRIPASQPDVGNPPMVARCGGPALCATCAKEAVFYYARLEELILQGRAIPPVLIPTKPKED